MSEEREYIPLEEAAAYVGVKRASLYYYLKELKIETHKFKFDKRAYITPADMERIKEIKDKPWLAGPQKESSEENKKDKEAA